MSSKSLRTQTLEQIHDEIMEDMKQNGSYDEIRVKLIEPIRTDPEFEIIIGKFELECEKFCRNVDLRLERHILRKIMIQHLDNSQPAANVKSHIAKVLKKLEGDIKSNYEKHAGAFLRARFIPDNNEDKKMESEECSQHEADMDMDIDSSPYSNDADDDDDDDIEKPTYSPIGNDQTSKDNSDLPNSAVQYSETNKTQEPIQQTDCNATTSQSGEPLKTESPVRQDDFKLEPQAHQEPIMTEPSLDDIPIPPEDDEFVEEMIPPPSEIKVETGIEAANLTTTEGEKLKTREEDEDEFEHLTFSDVSSVNTSDLSDFDNSIGLSDDEAKIVGLPKKSKVPIDRFELIDLSPVAAPSKSEIKMSPTIVVKPEPAESNELPYIGESDGGSEPTTGRRKARERKSNRRYEDFIP